MWMSSEQDPLCTSPNGESGPLANNAPLTRSRGENREARLVRGRNRGSVGLQAVDANNEEASGVHLSVWDCQRRTLRSSTRFVEVASRLGSRPGFVIDLLAGWNQEDQGHVEDLGKLVKGDDP